MNRADDAEFAARMRARRGEPARGVPTSVVSRVRQIRDLALDVGLGPDSTRLHGLQTTILRWNGPGSQYLHIELRDDVVRGALRGGEQWDLIPTPFDSAWDDLRRLFGEAVTRWWPID